MSGSSPSELPNFPPRIGRYQLLAPIGVGGMATVYLATMEGLGGFKRKVAIKLLHPQYAAQEASVRSFLNEARIAASLRHPNAVPVLDVGEDGQGVFLVMEYVEGTSLSALLNTATRGGSSLPLGVKLRIMSDALRGLHACHELTDDDGKALGIVHRDFSPQNILIGLDGRARLTDFGVARIAAVSSHTGEGVIKGKLRYMPPEQIRGRGSAQLDRRCDVWAAGVVTWELFAERRLHETSDEVRLLVDIVSSSATPLRQVRLDVPQEVSQVITRALARDRERRTPTAEAFRVELEQAFAPHVAAASDDDVAAWVGRLSAAARQKLAERASRRVEAEPVSAAASEATSRSESRSSGARASRRGSRAVVAVLAITGVVGLAAAANLYRPEEPVVLPAEESPARPFSSVTPTASPAPETPDPAPAPARMLSVKANAPVVRLKIGTVLHEYSPPETSWQAPLPELAKVSVEIEAESQDGRRVNLEHELRASELRIEFPPRGQRPIRRAKPKNTGLAPIDF